MKHALAALLGLALYLSLSHTTPAQTEVTLIGPGDMRGVVNMLTPGFEAKTGYKLKATIGSGGGTHKQVVQGDAFDVVIVQRPYQDVLDSGNVMKNTKTVLASVPVGVVVKEGAPKPDISSAAAIKKLLLDAKAVSFPDGSRGATAGVSMMETLKKLGITDQVMAKYHAGQPNLLTKGEVDLSLTFLSEVNQPGVEIVGPLPRSISTPTQLVAFVDTKAKDPAAAKALIKYLSGPEAAKVYTDLRMIPGK